jgi:hypothetical protein
MNAPINWEQLMIDALDGTISERDHMALEAYFDVHPEERAMFDRMQDVDRAFRAEPVISAPATLAQQVMGTTRAVTAAQPPLRASQIAFLILISSVLVVAAGAIIAAMYSLISPGFPVGEMQAFVAFTRGMVEFGYSFAGVLATFLRAVFSQPVTWVVVLGMIGVLAVWVRILAAVFVPAMRTAAA